MAVFPTGQADRDRFILERRPLRDVHDPWRSQGVTVEDERRSDGLTERVGTIFLTGRECPWRCLMCDLWKYTTTTDTPAGAIASQIRTGRTECGTAPTLKLYNAGNFFDPRAVPVSDYDGIAATLDGVARVIVESHPALIGPRVDTFIQALERRAASTGRQPPQVEIAMGLETAHPDALERLNKQLSVERFEEAAAELRLRAIDFRIFLLISPPFIDHQEQDVWLERSVATAMRAGATAISIIPSRAGNGAMEALAEAGVFRAPSLIDVERSFVRALAIGRSGACRIFVDLWNAAALDGCPACRGPRLDRLHGMNLTQTVGSNIACETCVDE